MLIYIASVNFRFKALIGRLILENILMDLNSLRIYLNM